MSAITTHVLDTSRGKPAANVAIVLESHHAEDGYREVGRGVTDADGRLRTLTPTGTLVKGLYRITFQIGAYYRALGIDTFYPEASIVFDVADAAQHYHVPLLLSPYGYSTYRGS
jgi:5-hydroxyisourate hydrolase